MSEMKNRVAKVLRDALRADPNCPTFHLAELVIQAMREPTTVMVRRGTEIEDGADWPPLTVSDTHAEAIYTAMIDQALKD